MPFVTTADAVDREAAWLNTLSGDSLPILPSSAGGSWDLIQAYMPRTAAQRKKQIWVMRTDFAMERSALIRSMPTYAMMLRLSWPLSSGIGSAEDDQRAFDLAINDVVMRVRGIPPGVTSTNPSGQPDKTHGGRFLSAAENPSRIEVHMTDPEQTITTRAAFEARIVYAVDDYDLND